MVQYRTIVADPPWRYKTTAPAFLNTKRDTHLMAQRGQQSRDDVARSGTPYPTMSIAEISALPVRDLAATDAHLYLWTTDQHLPLAFSVVSAWGFTHKRLLIWAKKPRGFCGYPIYNCRTEYVLFCQRGSLKAKTRIDRNWWEWPLRQHSQKPEAFQDLVEQVSPGPYLELFARRPRLGWDVWGNEVESAITMAAD